MDLKTLSTFIQVAEVGSFSRAGEKLGYSQPTVSIQIKQLEQALGIRLFDRIGHAVRLTDKGREALAYAQRICLLCAEMEESAGQHRDVGGVIRLAMADSLCPPLIDKGFALLREQYPHISIELTTAGTDELFRLLDHNEVDLVCTLDSHIYNANYRIAHEEKVGVHFVVAADSPWAMEGELTWEDLQSQSLFLTEKGMSYRRLLDEWLARESVEPRPVLEIGRADLMCRLVKQGMGMSFLPDYVTEDAVRRGAMVRLSLRGFEPELWMQLLYHRDKWVSRPMQAVIDHLSAISLTEGSQD